nr:uncharacterized protein LOC129447502 [Misgurnus anguillicaudatus]
MTSFTSNSIIQEVKNTKDIVARYKLALEAFKKGSSMKAAFESMGLDRATIAHTAVVAELKIAAPEAFDTIPPWNEHVKDVTKKLLKALEDPAEEDPATPAITSPPRSPESGPSTSRATEAEHLGERSPAHFPDHVAVLNELLESYRRHQEGPAPSRKLKENVSGKVFRIRSFMAHMAEGQGRLQTLAFLDNPERIQRYVTLPLSAVGVSPLTSSLCVRRWVGNLGKSKITATTVNHYLKNVAQFLDFLAETPPKTCRLSKNAMTRARREVRMLLRSMKRPVTMHQMEVKEVKEGQLISKQVLRRCNAEAKKAIPRILDKLEKDLCQKTQYSFYGHLTAFFASIYGHRCGVFQNLTITEVEKAVKSSSTGAYLINVKFHKTNQAFGPAQLSATEEEYGWLRRFLALRNRLVGGKTATYFFYIDNYFQGAWVSMGLPGKPNFTDLRTSIATHAKNSHSPDNRRKVAQFMCHDTSTADKFYAMNLNSRQAVEHRRMFEQALLGEDGSPEKAAGSEVGTKRKVKTQGGRSGKRAGAKEASPSESTSSSSSEEEEKVPLQESGVSTLDSPSSLETYPTHLESPDRSPSSSSSSVVSPSTRGSPEAGSPELSVPERATARDSPGS